MLIRIFCFIFNYWRKIMSFYLWFANVWLIASLIEIQIAKMNRNQHWKLQNENERIISVKFSNIYIQGVTKRKEKSKSNFCHEIVIKWLFWTQIIVSHIHPFTMTTITHHQCLFIEPMEVALKNPEFIKRENYWNIWEKLIINFSLSETVSC